MEVVTIMANLRGISESDVANRYTYHQVMHFANATMKEKMYLPHLLFKAFTPKKDKKGASSSDTTPVKTSNRGFPSWFTPKAGKYEIVDLDGPLDTLRAKANEYFGGKRTKKKKRR